MDQIYSTTKFETDKRNDFIKSDLPSYPHVYECNLLWNPKPLWADREALRRKQIEVVPDQIGQAIKNQELAISKRTFIKVYDNVLPEALHELSMLAKKSNFYLAGHTPIFMDAEKASNEGLKSIEHLTGVALACSSKREEIQEVMNERVFSDLYNTTNRISIEREQYQRLIDSYDPVAAEKVFECFKKNGTWLCPTLITWWNRAHYHQPDFQSDSERRALIDDFKKIHVDHDDSVNGLLRRLTDHKPEEQWYAHARKLVSEMNKRKVGLLAGTDSADGNPAYSFHGFSLHEELALLVDAGLSEMQAIQAATSNPAEFHRTLNSGSIFKEIKRGTIEEGAIADLVVLDANPLDNIRNTKRIYAVIADGKLYMKSDLENFVRETFQGADSQ